VVLDAQYFTHLVVLEHNKFHFDHPSKEGWNIVVLNFTLLFDVKVNYRSFI